jgi:hypothetical protein
MNDKYYEYSMSKQVHYRGVEEELGRILAPFFVTLVRLVFCTFVEVLAGLGIREAGSWVFPVAMAAAIVTLNGGGADSTELQALVVGIAGGIAMVCMG